MASHLPERPVRLDTFMHQTPNRGYFLCRARREFNVLL